MQHLFLNHDEFIITIEVVPPEGNDPEKLLKKLGRFADLPFHAFSVASNPVAKPKMSAMVFTHLIQKVTKKPAILHFTIRDHNRLGLQSELWGARALGIDTVIAVTGDPSARKASETTSTVGDLNVFQLITMAKDSGLNTGAVLDFRPEINGLAREAKRLEKKERKWHLAVPLLLPIKAGIEQARQMLELGKFLFSGACIMPPFDRFDILPDIFSI